MKKLPNSALLLTVLVSALMFGSLPETNAQSQFTPEQIASVLQQPPLQPATLPFASSGYWILSGLDSTHPSPPLPCRPDWLINLGAPVYALGGGEFGEYLVNDTEIPADTLANQASAASMGRFGAMGDFGGPGGGDGAPLFQFDTNGLFLEITNISAGVTYLNLCNSTNQVYAIWSATNLPPAWQVEAEVWPLTNSAATPFTVPTLGRPNLFLLAEDWTGVTANGNTTPLWWFWGYFGTTALSDGDADSQGINTLGYDYAHGLDPNVISFVVTTSNQYVNSNLVPLQLIIGAGVPSSMAVLVDNTNFSAAAWTNYNPNPMASLGNVEGWHQVCVGLRGRMPTSQQTWVNTRAKLLLTPPLLVITNPLSSMVSQPIIQLQGYCPEQISSITYSLANAAGSVSNQPVSMLDQAYDTNNYQFTTNYFQAFDVPVTNGANTITLRATDRAGNTSMTNLIFTLDYSGKTNPPVLTLGWPQNGTLLGSGSFTCSGAVSDPTAQVAAQFVDTNGVTNIVNGRVGRDGSFWLENLPLETETNEFTLTAVDAVGNASSTNLTVIQSDVTLTVDSISLMEEYAEGTVSDPTCTVWVNGMQANNYGDGYWDINGLNLTVNTLVVQARAIPSSDNGGSGTGGASSSGGTGGVSEDQGNPRSASGTDAETELAWTDPIIYVSGEYYADTDSPGISGPSATSIILENWTLAGGGTVSIVLEDSAGNVFLDYLQTFAPAVLPEINNYVLTDLLTGSSSSSDTLLWATPANAYDGDMDSLPCPSRTANGLFPDSPFPITLPIRRAISFTRIFPRPTPL